ncbi:MAG: hypothetical protein D6729_00435, partial [Deltaproteobacteria bacterium]
VLFWSGLGASAVALAGGAVLWWQQEALLHQQANTARAVVERGADPTGLMTLDAYERARNRRTLGISLVAGGLVLAGADALTFALTHHRHEGAALTAVAAPDGAMASVAWRLP